jgi:hypothetical protein
MIYKNMVLEVKDPVYVLSGLNTERLSDSNGYSLTLIRPRHNSQTMLLYHGIFHQRTILPSPRLAILASDQGYAPGNRDEAGRFLSMRSYF